MQFPHPPMPEFAPDQWANVTTIPRYEDVAQDGRIMPLALAPTVNGLWQAVIARAPGTRNSIAKGIIPILTRLTLTARDQPIRVDREIHTRAGYELAHVRTAGDPRTGPNAVDGAGNVARSGSAVEGDIARIVMNVWCEVSGMAGRIGPRQTDGDFAVAGMLFAEHTFTRPLAPPDQRRVTRLDAEGYPDIPPAIYDMPTPESAQDAPAGASWTSELAADSTQVAFTVDQSDSNQHINSLVYIRVFLDAAQRRIADAGLSLKIRSRAIDIAYRRPCFVGDRVRAHVRLFDHDGNPGAAGFIAGDDGKPRCYVRAMYSR